MAIENVSPRRLARVAGLFELLEGIGSSVGQVSILGGLLVSGNAASTAANILAHAGQFWLGFALSFLAVAFHVVWLVLFYELFKPVSHRVSLIAACVMLVGCALQAVTALLYLAPWFVLTGGGALSAFSTAQLQSLAYLFLRLNGSAFDAFLVMFGLWCMLTGYLILRSRFLPRVMGLLLMLDGLGWTLYLVPSFAKPLFPFIAGASLVAEFPLMLWLLIAGVNEQRWREQARGGA
jgi:hypothetical protein